MAKRRVFVNFLKEGKTALFDKVTGAIVTGGATLESFGYIKNQYFSLYTHQANAQLAATGMTNSVLGHLLPGDNTASDGVEITNGILLDGKSVYFTSGTDAFFVRGTFYVPTLANYVTLGVMLRKLGAYADTGGLAALKAAYSGASDDKAFLGITTVAGAIATERTKAGTDTEVAAAHAAVTAGDVVAFEISVTAARVVTCKIGHATPGALTYAGIEAARVAAIADLGTDATIAASTFSFTTAINFIPAITYSMGGSAAIGDATVLSFEAGAL